jgi:asparagine synthase (glutamine-hydrolysing)
MCGIVGFVTSRSIVTPDLIAGMASTLAHRGPDDAGHWLDQESGIALGHRRLSIVDLSPNGHQPMRSRRGRYVITFNGEIYNFQDIRAELESGAGAGRIPWRGHSDTEVMLEAIETWGFDAALRKFSGMFAFALWDREQGVLHLARDRLGEKPVYYGEIAGSFVFASELKALGKFPGARLEIDRGALAQLLQFQYIPAPSSIYRGIRKLEAGSVVSVRVAQGRFSCGDSRRYWSLETNGLPGGGARQQEEPLVEELHFLLSDAVRRQMVSDVPIGAFLSGGIDSSTIVALMQAHSARPVRTFTIGFREREFDEAQHAKAVARHLGTDHTEFYVTPKEAAAVIPMLPEIYDEPFADSSQIPTFLVSRLTRGHVTVSLSGDGGDELFAGYPRYLYGSALWRRISLLPPWSRRAGAKLIRSISAKSWDRLLGYVSPPGLRAKVTGHRLHRLAEVLISKRFADLYVRMVSLWQPANRIVIGAGEQTVRNGGLESAHGEPALNQMRRFDLEQYLPDDLLVKVDRASMSVGLESRAPMLDYRLAEFAWKLPGRLLVRGGQGKWILRQVLDRYVPRRLVERPKSGFGAPIPQWLRSELREWGEHLLDEGAIRAQGFFDPAPVRRMWLEHLSGQHDRSAYLWSVLMFQAWLGAQKTGSAAGAQRGVVQA